MEQIYKVNEFAKLLNVSIKTVQRWDSIGTLKAFRTPTDRRFYTQTQVNKYFGIEENKTSGLNVIYARVSSKNQKDDLKNQIEFLQNYANAKGIIVDLILEDIGSGLNYNRKNWNDLLNMCQEGKINTLFLAHKDRFIRFGYSWFENFLLSYGVKIIVVNNEKLSPEQELVQDLISITHVFSCRIYGLRKYKKVIKQDPTLC